MKQAIARFFRCLGPALSSLFLPGLGQLWNRQGRKGMFLLACTFSLVLLGFALPIAWILPSLRNAVQLNWDGLVKTGAPIALAMLLAAAAFVLIPVLQVYAALDAFMVANQKLAERERFATAIANKIINGELPGNANIIRDHILKGEMDVSSQFSNEFMDQINTNSNDLAGLIKWAIEKAEKARGKVNILVLGKAGVGKSTLVNEIFQGNFALTDQGRPVTTTISEYSKEGIPLTIFDTPGLELRNYDQAIKDLNKLIRERRADPDLSHHIHLAWYCIAQDTRRVEEAETKLTDMLKTNGIPTIAVITKATAQDEGFSNLVRKLLPNVDHVVRVRALRTVFDDGHIIPPAGLDTLVEVTMKNTPDAAKNALAAAVKDISTKERQARIAVGAASAAAATIGITPIPFSDAVLIIPVQIAMLASISSIYGLRLDRAFLGTLISGAITSTGATAIGKSAVAGLLKLIPGAGSVVGGAISGSVAALLTTSFGEAYIRTLSALLRASPDRMPTTEQIAASFTGQLKQRKQISTP